MSTPEKILRIEVVTSDSNSLEPGTSVEARKALVALFGDSVGTGTTGGADGKEYDFLYLKRNGEVVHSDYNGQDRTIDQIRAVLEPLGIKILDS
jgi:hypothetical protein